MTCRLSKIFMKYFYNKSKAICLNLILLLLTVPLFGQTFTVNKVNFKTTGVSTVEVSGCGFYDEKDSVYLQIPASVTYLNTTYSVTSIGKRAFTGKNMLITVSIPASVRTIGEYAFSDCSKISSIAIPSSETIIEEGAFMYCRSLLSISIPESVNSIPKAAFANCYSLKNIIIPTSVVSIGEQAFSRCESLDTITIPESVNSIGRDAFSNCRSLKRINIPNAITIISTNTFSGCTSLTEITIPTSVRSIRGSAFSGCRSLQSVNFSSPFDSVESHVSLDSIGSFAFSSCVRLKKISIPASVTSIGYGAFGDSDFAEVYSYNPLPQGFTDPIFSGHTRSYSILYVPAGSKEIYRTTNGWKAFKNIVEMGSTGLSSSPKPDMDIIYNTTSETLQFNGAVQSAHFELYSLSGVRIISTTIELDVPVSIKYLRKGIYVAKISCSEGEISKKILKR